MTKVFDRLSPEGPRRVNVTCDKCNKRYSIADDKVRGKSVKIRCKQCQNLITVQGPADAPVAVAAGGSAVSDSGWEDEHTRAMPAMNLAPVWHVMVKGKQVGPVDLRGLEQQVKAGEVTIRSYVWKQGMAEWKRASDVPEVAPVFAGVNVAKGPAVPAPAAKAPPAPPPADFGESPTRAVDVQSAIALANVSPSPDVTRAKPASSGPTGGKSHAGATALSKKEDFGKLFDESELKVPSSEEPVPQAEAPAAQGESHGVLADVPTTAETGQPEIASLNNDPFAALGGGDPSNGPAPGEATKFFIAQAGVNKRNPPWKIALFVASPLVMVGLVAVILNYLGPKYTVTTADGEEVEAGFFTAVASGGIQDVLSGEAARRQKAKDDAARKAAELARIAAIRKANEAKALGPQTTPNPLGDDGPRGAAGTVASADLANLYGNRASDNSNSPVNLAELKGEVKGPKIRLDDSPPPTSKGDLDQGQVSKIIGQNLPSYTSCIEQALKKNPNMKVGAITVALTVGPSGTVTQTKITPAQFDASDWGSCIRTRSTKIKFPPFDSNSEPAEIQIPLKIGVGL